MPPKQPGFSDKQVAAAVGKDCGVPTGPMAALQPHGGPSAPRGGWQPVATPAVRPRGSERHCPLQADAGRIFMGYSVTESDRMQAEEIPGA